MMRSTHSPTTAPTNKNTIAVRLFFFVASCSIHLDVLLLQLVVPGAVAERTPRREACACSRPPPPRRQRPRSCGNARTAAPSAPHPGARAAAAAAPVRPQKERKTSEPVWVWV
ncbi:uncharacterized protein Tco025E_02796 [Trypanosoma conorhini]|uniref:Uncharacterized protein n=1 Tax=Trypanosoma conorhini TaxID=83891 RepID=A0A3R7S842_9TRYP|nr:uncharacterized protein Tco025E_02796 [Trypanosoma conorhini]RNF23504.1 hypothetical protein Tco025E_02796 [Trypanosoma conorhini]